MNCAVLEGDFLCLPPGCSLDQLAPGAAQQCSHTAPLLSSTTNSSCSAQSSSQLSCTSSSHYVWPGLEMTSTGVTDWALVCGDQYKVGLSSSLYFVGLMLGSLLTGALSDRWGRRPTLLVMLLTTSLACGVGAACPDYWSYSTSRVVVGAGAQGLFILGFSLSVEVLILNIPNIY